MAHGLGLRDGVMVQILQVLKVFHQEGCVLVRDRNVLICQLLDLPGTEKGAFIGNHLPPAAEIPPKHNPQPHGPVINIYQALHGQDRVHTGNIHPLFAVPPEDPVIIGNPVSGQQFNGLVLKIRQVIYHAAQPAPAFFVLFHICLYHGPETPEPDTFCVCIQVIIKLQICKPIVLMFKQETVWLFCIKFFPAVLLPDLIHPCFSFPPVPVSFQMPVSRNNSGSSPSG